MDEAETCQGRVVGLLSSRTEVKFWCFWSAKCGFGLDTCVHYIVPKQDTWYKFNTRPSPEHYSYCKLDTLKTLLLRPLDAGRSKQYYTFIAKTLEKGFTKVCLVAVRLSSIVIWRNGQKYKLPTNTQHTRLKNVVILMIYHHQLSKL